MGRPQLVLIEWLDSHGVSGWTTDDPSQKPLRCMSVGWLVYDGLEAKTVAPHVTNEDPMQRFGEMTIPAVAIISLKYLVE